MSANGTKTQDAPPAKSFKEILEEAKRNRFDDYTKGMTVVREKHFTDNNEELAFARGYIKLTSKPCNFSSDTSETQLRLS